MKRCAFLSLILVTLMGQSVTAKAQDWSINIKKEPVKVYAQRFGKKINEHLEIVSFMSDVQGKPHLTVYLRNGHNKKGASSIGLKYLDTETKIQVQRVQISKPMSIISGKPNGTHLFETFTEKNTEYQIFYTVNGGKIAPQVTLKLSGAKHSAKAKQ